MTSCSNYRMALLGEGIRVPTPITIGGVEVTAPTFRLGDDIPARFTDLLHSAGFVDTIDHPSWMALSATRRVKSADVV